jgi:cation:H+ antiporter
MGASALLMLAGIGCAVAGGDLFVRGVVSLAAWWRVPAGIIGATVAAFATSSPELSVAVNAALESRPQVALGDALGSNVVNVGVVLGLALAFSAITVDRGALVRDVPMALAAPAVLGLLALDGTVSRVDAVVLIVVFAGWLTQTTIAARAARDAVVSVLAERSHRAVVVSVVAGLVLLVVAGRFIVSAAAGISQALGWDGFVVGAVFVALGTSTPEIATMLAARVRGHDEVGVGTVLGSNIFNTLLVVGVAALISPITVTRSEIQVGVVASIVVVALAVPGRSARLGRWRSVPLLATYVVVITLISSGQNH